MQSLGLKTQNQLIIEVISKLIEINVDPEFSSKIYKDN